jgi:hypothetical protein
VLSKTHLPHSLPLSFPLLFFLDFNKFCFEDNDSGYTWEETPVGTSVVKKCPAKTIGAVLFYYLCYALWIYLFINFTINKTIQGTDNRTEESQIKSYLHITLTL